MIRRLLIANRGEIALRVMRTCREMGIETVAVHSDVDARARHVLAADRAVPLGGAAAADSYLSVERIVQAARDTGADAIHPGYGFLSENAAFATACAAAGVTFVGPPPDALALMGSKTAAREVAERAGVPVVPGGVPTDQSSEGLAAVAERTGFPVLLKPAAGGGGIGMKVVREPQSLAAAVEQARREAVAAFGDGTLYVERQIARPRHIEVQVLADAHGHLVHLFERECSLQRRHQKVIEETPSPAVTSALRRRLGDAAVAVARGAGYRNAGTVEFLVEGHGDDATFYFLEMNARLQVEHPITEASTGVDLVRAQLMIAAGEPLPFTQETLGRRGHAIELRIYAEDPARDFLPQAGRVVLYRPPSIPGVRIDSGIGEGDEVTIHYDPLLVKLIAAAETREQARQKARAALREFPILGLVTNAAYLGGLLDHPRFVAGDLDTHFLSAEHDRLIAPLQEDAPPIVAALAASAHARPATSAPPATDAWRDPWERP